MCSSASLGETASAAAGAADGSGLSITCFASDAFVWAFSAVSAVASSRVSASSFFALSRFRNLNT